MSTSPKSTVIREGFRRWFFTPPRRHGESIEDRTVSFLELFYDLVYVVLIAQIAHTLAGHVSWRGVGEFVVVFGLIWLAWLSGTLQHELHGREDGRGRSFIFVQMSLLAVLSVYAGHAAEEDGKGFAVVYTIFLLLLTYQWYGVYRVDDAAHRAIAGRFLVGMGVFTVAMAVSAFLDPTVRIVLWAVLVIGSLVGNALLMRRFDPEQMGITVTESMVERFGLFTIIVLGEVVVGVVEGLSESDRTTVTVATGVIALIVGFGLWWSYFDFIGRRLPRMASLGAWMPAHLPLSMSIAGAGAAMVSLIEHAHDARSPVATTWLIVGAFVVMVLSLGLAMRSLEVYERFPELYRPILRVLELAAVAGVGVGLLRPSPILLVGLLAIILTLVWVVAFANALQHPEFFESADD